MKEKDSPKKVQKAKDATRVGVGGGSKGGGSFSGSREKNFSLQKEAAKWLSDDTDSILLATEKNEKAIVWESLRYLFFAKQLSPFWETWIQEGGDAALKRFRVKPSQGQELCFPPVNPPLSEVLISDPFPCKNWKELDKIEKIKTPKLDDDLQKAVSPLRVSTAGLYGVMEWAWYEMKSSKKAALPFDVIWGPIAQRVTSQEPPRSQLVVEIDWNQGIESICDEFKKMIQPLWKTHHPKGRKPRGEDPTHFFKGLVLLRRIELRSMDWKEAEQFNDGTRVFGGGDEKKLHYRGGLSASKTAVAHAREKLQRLQELLAEEEQRLCHGFDMNKWAADLGQGGKG